VKLVGSGIVSVGAYSGKELGVVVKRTCQLMSVALVKIGEKSIVPFQSFVAVEGIATAYTNVFEILVCLHESTYFLEVGH
jgi:hypothetical protein